MTAFPAVFLKSLTLKGFKSFADTTTLDLEPGITVVVGPNGSGKSNIVDAVAWVLGAQASKTIRSNKMEDVIFAGTSKRPALGRTEVSLTIDNHSGVLPIGFTEVTIMRTLFRSGDSEYAINGVSCRLLDIQELLSDSGVGRQQHVIVGQGQLAAVLDSRPEDRRAVIEEAAGILKYRRRRERSQRRLESTEANFVRLGDLLREIRRQRRPLERQADAARRHDGLQAELRAIRMFIAGRDLAALKARSNQYAGQRTELGTVENDIRQRLARLDADVITAESALTVMGGGLVESTGGLPGWDGLDVSDALARCESLYQKARGLLAFLGERRRSIERDRNAYLDQDVVATLEAEAARITDELDRVDSETMVLPPQFEELAEQEESVTADRARFLDEWGNDEGPTTDGPTAAQVRGELNGARQAVSATASEQSRLEQRIGAVELRLARLVAEAQRVATELGGGAAEQVDVGIGVDIGVGIDFGIDAATERRVGAEAALAVTEAELAAAQELLREHEGEERAWAARNDALTTALDAARARAGAKRLAGLDGIVGTLLDLVEVDSGWEPAVEAALGEAISAVVVRDATVARAALQLLHGSSESGAVLALDALSRSNPSAADLSGVPGEPVRHHVRARNADAEVLLDRLLMGAVAVQGTWSDALDVALAHPQAVVVTRTGDRFSASGWRAGAGAVGATGAALEQASAAAQLASATATATRDMIVGARTAAKAARLELDTARSDEQRITRDLERNQARLASLTQQRERLLTERSEVERELAGVVVQRAEFADRHQRELQAVAVLDSRLPALVEAETELALRQAQRRDASQRLDERARAIATLRRDLEVQAAGLEERARVLGARQLEIDERLSRSIAERAVAEIRRIELDLLAERTEALHAVVQDRAELIEGGLALLRDERRRQSEAARAATSRLDGLRKERAGVEKHLVETRERLQRNELEVSEVRLRIETLVEQVRREFDVEPERVMESECPELVDGTSAPTRLRDLERELRLMGPINPLALEEFTALEERHALIEVQLDDVKSTRRELAKVISAIDEEIITVFAAAYADVEENFAKLFGSLFPGGSGHLRLTDPDNPLDTGVEVEARPSGKNVRKLSLLSGGERSLTALAFLFAVFRSRPSPFYLLDEVEAALDDVNLTRFLGLLAEFRQEAQLLVVSHQKRTMEAADCLYGVTMQPGGSSKVVSERVALNA